ncbi:MAG TPA: putative peptidoglycan glycosyltransferase FtsW [Candidatus Saccharimonadales bacterium]|nr:putative peptidoglycan glycosyltransferase FtsW [Candidatus Saccharimonadales bacterium]
MSRRHRPDYWLLILCALMLAIGLVVVYAISPALAVEKNVDNNYFVNHQLIAIGLGLCIFGITSRVPLEAWKKLGVPLLVVAGVATIIALLLPVNANYPAHRWIRLGGLSFQSVELLKFAFLVWTASFLAMQAREGRLSDARATLRPLGIALGVAAVIVAFIQSDLGSAGVMIAMGGTMVFVAGMPMKRLILGVIAIVLLCTVAITATPYRRDRLQTYLNPQADCLNAGYQACQALIAVGTGGMIGLGLGKSVQAFGYLPEAENDSIFAIYAEKFGFIGVTLLLGILLVLFARLKAIMERAPDDFTRLVVAGIFAWLAVQALINIGAMLGMLPLKGITLPFISYGGTSILLVMAAMGLVFQVSRYTLYSVPRQTGGVSGGRGYENSPDRSGFRGAYHPGASSRS